ncbi:MAG: InlB B-repeat-containing protein [Treponema sp.]|nr:InlB B-repeat-containing protein [Treponema sp.]
MKKMISKVVAFIFAVLMLFNIAGCSVGIDTAETGETETKTETETETCSESTESKGSEGVDSSGAEPVKPEISETVYFTVSFESGEDCALPNQKVENGKTATKPENPSRSGYVFLGWYSDAELNSKFDFEMPITEDLKLYSKWDVIYHQVTFESNGGSSIFIQKVENGKTVDKPINPKKNGCEFIDWYTDGDFSTKFDFSIPITEDVKLYAKWETVYYTVTFESNGGTACEPQKIQSGENAVEPINPKRNEAAFLGWYTNSNFSVKFDFSTPITKDTKLYAQWNILYHTVTFDTKGGSEVASQIIERGTCVVCPNKNPTKSGYKFAGWYDYYLKYKYDFTKPVRCDTTVYAKWEIDYCYVVFETNGGNTLVSKKIQNGKTVEKPSDFHKKGYKFLGWYADSDLKNEFDFSTPITKNIALYAKWEAVYHTVIFEAGNASSNTTQQVLDGYTVYRPSLSPKRDGFEFLGWYADSGFTEKFDFGTYIQSDTTIYARWWDSRGFVAVTGTVVTGAVADSKVFITGRIVTIPSIYVCDHEVTQKEYETYCAFDEAHLPEKDLGKGDNYPAYNIGWREAIIYCNKRSIAEGLTPCYSIDGSTNCEDWIDEYGHSYAKSAIHDNQWYPICDFNANGYRLPTEVEWEYVARGGNRDSFIYSGSNNFEDVAFKRKEVQDPYYKEVKTYLPNSLGIYDMSGSVYEWCFDWKDDITRDTDSTGPRITTTPTSLFYRVRRGGLTCDEKTSRVYSRNSDIPYGGWDDGFRVVRTIVK